MDTILVSLIHCILQCKRDREKRKEDNWENYRIHGCLFKMLALFQNHYMRYIFSLRILVRGSRFQKIRIFII